MRRAFAGIADWIVAAFEEVDSVSNIETVVAVAAVDVTNNGLSRLVDWRPDRRRDRWR